MRNQRKTIEKTTGSKKRLDVHLEGGTRQVELELPDRLRMEDPETADDDPVGHDLSTTSGEESGVVKTSEMVAVQLTGCNGVDLE